MRLWVGTYPDVDGVVPPAEGVWRVDVREDGTLVDRGRAAALAQASFIALHPHEPVLYATQELEPGGAVAAFAVGDPDEPATALRLLGVTPSGGGYPCHLEVAGGAVAVSCYGSGAPGSAVLGSIPLDAAGGLTGPVRTHQHAGTTGPRADRQESSHVHSATRTRAGAHAWAADLGTDELVRYRVTPDGLVPDGVAMRMPAGSGPRHLVMLPDDVAVVACELDSTVAVVQLPDDASPGNVLQVLPACATPAGDGPSQPSHITLNAAGTRVHVGVRGQDVIATFAVEPCGSAEPSGGVAASEGALVPSGAAAQPAGGSGRTRAFDEKAAASGAGAVRLRHLADTPCGEWPRHHAVLESVLRCGVRDAAADLVVVAAQGSAELVALEIGADGVGRVLSRLGLGVRPSCVLPA